MERLLARALEPGCVLSVLHTFQKLFVIYDRDDNGDGLASSRHNFRRAENSNQSTPEARTLTTLFDFVIS